MTAVVDKVVLESYLKKLYLSTFIRYHEAYAAEAAQSNQSYTRFLLALAEQEVLAREARRRQRRLNELIKAQDEGRVTPFINKALKHKLIVIDELGFIPFSSTGAQLMFQLCSALYERVALIVTTNLKFADWTQVFGDERLTVALLDRLTHKAHIVEFTGDSYRFRERRRRQEEV